MTKTVVLKIDSLAAGGDGVARNPEGRVTFVPRTAPGDVARVRLREERKQFARGQLVDLESPGPGRVEAPCALFVDGVCGGCQWQHVSASVQRDAKEALVKGALRKLIDGGLEVAPIRTPVPEWGWRRRARLHWFRGRRTDRATIGFFRPGSHHVTEVPTCPQLTEPANAALAAIQTHLAPGLHKGGDISILVGDGGGCHVVVDGPCSVAAVERLAADPAIAGVQDGPRRYGQSDIPIDGGLVGRADRFFQASAEGNRTLLQVVGEMAEPRGRILELYAGAGNFTRVLAEGALEVVAVERDGKGPALPNVKWKAADVNEYVTLLAGGKQRFDWVVLDPPRKGAADICDPLAGLATKGVIYVSCDPATLARDLGQLAKNGLTPVRSVPVDTMPQTAHVEVITLLSR